MKGVKLFFVFIFFSSLSFSQSWIWGRDGNQLTGFSEGYATATDKNGNVYLSGGSDGKVVFGTDTLTSTDYSVYLVKYTSSGNFLWAKQSEGNQMDFAYSAATDNNNNVYVTGEFTSSKIIFGSDTLINSGGNDIFLVKYSTNGTVLWAKNAIGSTDISCSVVTDKRGNVYITGYYNSHTLTFGSVVLTNNGLENIFIAKYDSAGTIIWAKSFGGTNFDEGYAICVDKHNYVYLTGSFSSPSITFGSSTLNSPDEFFIAKFDSNGNPKWAKTATSNTFIEGLSVKNDLMGNIYVTGDYYADTVKFGSHILNPIGANRDIFLTKYDSSGNVLWALSGGSYRGDSKGFSVVTDTLENVYLGGGFPDIDTLHFGSFSIMPISLFPSDPSFVIKFDSSGKPQCGSSIASGGDDQNCIAIDSKGYIYFGSDIETGELIIGPDTLIGPNEFPFIAQWKPCTNKSDAGINELTLKNGELTVFPNPNNGKFMLNMENDGIESTIEIYNILGEKVFSMILSQQNYNSIDISSQPNGIYLYRAIAEDGRLLGSGKVIIQK